MEGILEDLRQRALRRSILLGEVKRREYRLLLASQALAPYLAQSPNLPKSLVRELAERFPFYAARNPRTYEVPEAVGLVLRALAETPIERLREPSTLEGKALRHLIAHLEKLPKGKRRTLVRLATEAGLRIPDLGPLLSPEAQG